MPAGQMVLEQPRIAVAQIEQIGGGRLEVEADHNGGGILLRLYGSGGGYHGAACLALGALDATIAAIGEAGRQAEANHEAAYRTEVPWLGTH